MSDSRSSDSDEGIRYKTESVRNKSKISKRKKSCSPSPPRRKSRETTSGTSSSSSYKEESIEDKCFGPKPADTIVSPIIGPSLPPNLLKSSEDNTEKLKPTLSRSPEATTLQPVIGPSLPPHLLKSREEHMENVDSESTKLDQSNSSQFGPALPQHLSKDSGTASKEVQPVIGPSLPPNLLEPKEDIQPKIIGPALPDHIRMQLTENQDEQSSESIDIPEDVYGPLPPNLAHNSGAHRALEERALELKINQLGPQDSDQPARETWMLELPEAKAARFGLGPRQFRSKAGPDMSDRSSWTDIPGEKNKHKIKKDETHNLKQEAELRESRKRDKEQEKFAKKHKKDEKSLLDIHKEKRDKEKKDAGPAERKPFNRETDLQVNRFDEAQRKAVLKKAQLLDDRFSSGKSKYL